MMDLPHPLTTDSSPALSPVSPWGSWEKRVDELYELLGNPERARFGARRVMSITARDDTRYRIHGTYSELRYDD